MANQVSKATDKPQSEAKTYNHAFTLAFAVSGSECKDGNDVTAERMVEALQQRIKDLMANDEMLEAVGGSFDTYEEE